MKFLKAKFEPTVEEIAAFRIVATVMSSGQRTFTEESNIANDVWVCCPTGNGIKKEIVPDYDLGKKTAIDNGWVFENNGRMSITSVGESALKQRNDGTYQRPVTESLLDRLRKWSTNNAILVVAIVLCTTAGVIFGVANNVFDVCAKFSAFIKPTQVEDRPDFSLRLVYPESPALVISNPSNKVVREIKYSFALWNLRANSITPLPIKVATFDWIGAKSSGGPQLIFEPTFNLKKGDQIVGSMSASCPEGTRGRTYLVSLVWGEGGWTAELEKEKSGSLIVPEGKLTLQSLRRYTETIKRTPQELRKPILATID